METNSNNTVKASWDVMINHLQEDAARLFESEKELLRTEMNEKIAEAKAGVSSLLLAASLLLVGSFTFVATAIMVLDQYMPLVRASGIVTATLFAGGFIVLKIAQKKLSSIKMKSNQRINGRG